MVFFFIFNQLNRLFCNQTVETLVSDAAFLFVLLQFLFSPKICKSARSNERVNKCILGKINVRVAMYIIWGEGNNRLNIEIFPKCISLHLRSKCNQIHG